MSNNVTSIGQGAFEGCSSLTSITLSLGLENDPQTIHDGSTTYAQYWGIPNTATIINCFLENTQILCFVDNREIYVPIQDIQQGYLVKTYLHGYKKVEIIARGTIYNKGDDSRIKDRLFKYRKEDYPELIEDLIVTGGHSSLVDILTESQEKATNEFWKVPIKTDDKFRLLALVDENTVPYEKMGVFPIYHFSLENDDELANYGIYANGLLLETCSKFIIKKNNELMHI